MPSPSAVSALVTLFMSLLAASAADSGRSAPVANTTSGVVRGAWSPDGSVASFRGIPYAAPPVGDLRWRSPKPASSWTGVRDALADGAACPQDCKLPSVTCPKLISEDCLFLNVFTPSGFNSGEAKPVMFFIHGGDFYQGYGGGILYDGTRLVRDHDVVMIAINYRLGALGFLYSGPDEEQQFTGNFGIKDQQAALRWAQANAAAFGGDPSRVTLFGQSAGASSIATHLNMPSSSGLFRAAILESDPMSLPFRTTEEFPSFTKLVAKTAGCVKRQDEVSNVGASSDTAVKLNFSGKDSYEQCMRHLSADQVVAAQVKAEKDVIAALGTDILSLFQPFTPTVGTPELAVQPLRGFMEGTALDVPLIFGSVTQEGVIFVYQAFGKPEPAVEEDGIIAAIYGLKNVVKIDKEYPRTKQDRRDSRNHTAIVATDSLFDCAIRAAANNLTYVPPVMSSSTTKRQSPVFVYHFDHVISFGPKFWNPLFPECVNAVCHSEELPFVFNGNWSTINASFTTAESALAGSIQTYWTNFAKTLNPGDAPSSAVNSSLISWPKFDSESEQAVLFTTSPGIKIVRKYLESRCNFWDDLGYTWIL